ncbi:DUF11 domain-containing protein [Tautonia plasticadhaerens]|uniref:DUF11 domain-containing protein n=1 Tax=Tautonia plasticadhaerens TaxID=2527974 RepID=A0A518GUL3_9BACT|nr:DUF11 domain-containing protein [Tautonia plasticadhaerens]QDV32285.1 hypothetical protein ElP_01130 [Tautonia plasticadhaerens]
MGRNRSARKAGARGARPGVERCEDRRLMATFVVATAADGGDDAAPTAGSLREAILLANASPGEDRIAFAIGSGPQTIAPPTPLPALTDPVVVDGSTQPGFAGSPLIELNGANIAGFAQGLRISTGQSTIRSLVINRFSADGLSLAGDGNLVVGNFIGTDRTGMVDFGNGDDGIEILSRNNTIGGTSPGDANVISGNDGDGIFLVTGSQPANNVIQGNRIGTDPGGTQALGNGANGLALFGSQNIVGGTGAGQANAIAFNGRAGVVVGSFFSNEQGNAIRANAIRSNGGLGIDLGDDGVTLNDPSDADGGPNLRQDFPVVDAAFPGPGGTVVQGRLASRPGSSFSVDFFANDQADPTGFGEGQQYLGSAVVMTGPDGSVAFDLELPAAVPPGRLITATATDAAGNTSEFSEARLVADAARADLAASLSPSPGTIRVGQELTLSAGVRNLGPARATGVTVSVPLPEGFDFVAATPTRGSASFADGVVTASIGELGAGQSASVNIRVVPRAVGVVAASASVASDLEDPDAGNDAATVNLDVQPPVPADLAISASTRPSPATVGEPFEYTAVVVNRGGNPRVDGVSVTIELPEGLAVRAIDPSQGTASQDGRVVTASIGSLDRDANATVRLTLVPESTDRLAVVATVRAGAPDPDATNNNVRTELDVTAQPPIDPADLGLVAFLSGESPVLDREFEYTVLVTNGGPSPRAGDVVLTTELPEGLELTGIAPSQGSAERDGRTVTVRLGELPSGANAVVRFRLTPRVADTLEISSAVRSDRPDPNALDNVVRLPVSVSQTPLVDLAVGLSASPPSPRVGEAVSYTISVVNGGPGDAGEVELLGELPEGAELVLPPSTSQGTVELVDGDLVGRLGSLGPGQVAIVSYVVRTAGTGVLTASATVSSDRADPNPANNRAMLTTPVASADPADLVVGLVTVPEPATVGEPLRYSVVASNSGPGVATGTVVRVPLPSGVELVGIKPSQGSAALGPDGVLTLDLGTLAPGGQALVELLVVPRALGPLEISATIEGAGPDFNPANNRAVSATAAVPAEVAPVVSGQQLVSSPRGISAIVLAFSRPLDPALAAFAGNYAIRQASGDGRPVGRPIGLRSVAYDPLARTVTLVPSRILPLGRYFLLQANAPGGPGLTGADGAVLDGDFDGLPDGIYEDLVGRGTPTRPRRLQRGPLSRELPPSAPPSPLPPAPIGTARPFAAALAARAARLAGRGEA